MFGDKCGGYMLCLVNQLLGFRLTSEHNDAPDVLESAGSTCEVIGTGGDPAVSGRWTLIL